MYACIRRKSSSVNFPLLTKFFPKLIPVSFVSFSASSISARDTSPESKINSFNCDSSICIVYENRTNNYEWIRMDTNGYENILTHSIIRIHSQLPRFLFRIYIISKIIFTHTKNVYKYLQKFIKEYLKHRSSGLSCISL